MLNTLLFHSVCCYLFICFFLVVTQHLQIFPGFLRSQLRKLSRSGTRLPTGVSASFVKTSDNQSIDVWCLPPDEHILTSPYIAIIFHGNAGSLEDFMLLQLWCQERGLKSYSFDYRGFGRSSGFPTEQGVYRDSDAFVSHVLEQESCKASSLIVIGFSLGGALAARVAATHSVHTLVLISSFTSVDDVVKEIPLFGFLRYTNMIKLPTRSYLKEVTSSNIIIIHSKRDKTVPYKHAKSLCKAYQGDGQMLMLSELEAGHNGTFYMQRYNLAAAFRSLEILPGLHE